MMRKKYRVFTTSEFDKWFSLQTTKEREQIRKRISYIELEGYFGDHKSISESNPIWELRWVNGRRVYYAYLLEQNILLLLGGNKNGQNHDIKQAHKIYEEAT